MNKSWTILFVLLTNIIVVSCGNRNTPDAEAASLAAKKETCTACKSPSSRAALINASFKASSNVVSADKAGMVFIKGGTFQMGSNDFTDSKPVHAITVNSFYMDEHEVTNAQFAAFVKATGYVTVAEQPLNPADFPGVPADKLVPGSPVFT